MIFDRHADAILRYAHARLGPDLAEDVLAETFLALFARRASYDQSRPNCLPWLYGIAIRQIGKHRRAEHRSREAMARLPVEAVALDTDDRCLDRVDAQALRPRLMSVLSGLTRQDRELLLLIAWGLPHLRRIGGGARPHAEHGQVPAAQDQAQNPPRAQPAEPS